MRSELAVWLTVVAAFTVVLDPPRLSAASSGWPSSVGGNGHFYEVVRVPGGITWDAAKAAAESRGGYLATLTSVEENALMFFTLEPPSDGTWNDQPAGTPWVVAYVTEFDAQPIPEPGAWFGTLGLSALALAVATRWRSKGGQAQHSPGELTPRTPPLPDGSGWERN